MGKCKSKPWWDITSHPLESVSSVQSLSHVRLFETPWITARQASLSITISRSSLRLTSIESMVPSSHLILGHPLLLLPPISPSNRVFSSESTLRMRWPKNWSFSLDRVYFLFCNWFHKSLTHNRFPPLTPSSFLLIPVLFYLFSDTLCNRAHLPAFFDNFFFEINSITSAKSCEKIEVNKTVALFRESHSPDLNIFCHMFVVFNQLGCR